MTAAELKTRLRLLADKEREIAGQKARGEGSLQLGGVLAQGPNPDADAAVLEALEKALAAEKGDAPADVARAWRAVAALAGNNPYRAEAELRARLVEALCRMLEAERPKLELVLTRPGFSAAQRKGYLATLRTRFGSLPAAARWLDLQTAPKCPPGMVGIPGGVFKDTGDSKGTTYVVDDYCMDATEVTTSAYSKCLRTGRCAGVRPCQ